MCFGPQSSFTASVVLSAIGTACVSRVSRKQLLLLAAVPLIFGLQQFIEGWLWIALENESYEHWRSALTKGFLIVAFLWPVIAPCCIYILEPQRANKKPLLKFLIFGISVSAYLLFFLLTRDSSASTADGRIVYDVDTPAPDIFDITLYACAVLGSMFFSSYRQIVILGIVNIVLCGVAAFMWYSAFISVWCFFAAVLSALIYLFLRQQRSLSVTAKLQMS